MALDKKPIATKGRHLCCPHPSRGPHLPGVVWHTDGKKGSPSPTKAKCQASQTEEKNRATSPKKVKITDFLKIEKNITLELKKKDTELSPMVVQ
uniref:Uncharacterized protein n=1 Tax=Zea mays TaxID=4577 RepID=A0A804MUW6_MAIZE